MNHSDDTFEAKVRLATAPSWRPTVNRLWICVAALLALGSGGEANAQALPLIRDTEIERLLKDYTRPIFKVAPPLDKQNITVRIVNADVFNAFVADGQNIFINTGVLTQSKTPNEVIGVLAHETGHITGGHMAALRARIARDQTKAALISILGIGAMIAGGTSKSDNGRSAGAVGQGVMLGGNEVIMRGILAERRSQESAADQAGLSFLNATQQSGRGMLAVFERFRQQEYISERDMDPFVRTHPVASDRLARLEDAVNRSPYRDKKDPPALQLRHDLVKAKIIGFMDRPEIVTNTYPQSDRSQPARYARAIAANCAGKCAKNLEQIDALISEAPQNPYFVELKADILFASGKVRESIPLYRKAITLAGGASLMEISLAQSLLATEDPAMLDEALTLLRKASISEADNAAPFELLARAYNRKGMRPQADLAEAERQFARGDLKAAVIFARRAQQGLKQGSPEWNRSVEIITYKPPLPG